MTSAHLVSPSPANAPVDCTPATGLEPNEAARRLAVHGPNQLSEAVPRQGWRWLKVISAEPMFLLLALAAAIYLLLGDPAEGLLLAGFAGMSVALVVHQQARSERALAALRELGAPLARVLRAGAVQRIPAAGVVPGDLLLLGEGERVAADGVLRRCEGLSVDESLLTGESVPVRKRARGGAEVDAPVAAGGDDQPWVHAGTLVTAGHGVVEVRATGARTAAGGIGAALAQIRVEPTLLQRNVARLARLFGVFALLFSLGFVLLYGALRGDWLQAVLSGIALAMALLPEEFPVALTIFLALGSWRLARIKVLVRWPAVVETLGATGVLCVDKTGTLTENRMRIRALAVGAAVVAVDDDTRELPEDFHAVLEMAVLASRPQGFDPMDLATRQLGSSTLAGTEHLHAEWPLQREYGLTAELPALVRVWQQDDGRWLAAAKGAPEAIATLCQLEAAQRAELLEQTGQLAARGLRVLAVAAAVLPTRVLPEDPRALVLKLHGLVAFADPLRASVPAAVAAAREAGIAVVMITGDFPATALAIAAAAGIDVEGGVIDGAALDAMQAPALAAAAQHTRIFARIRPEQKLRLVEAFKARGAVVAMTGDGVNDAPALKSAHIGLAMGSRATDVAREAAGIVLLDDDFAHLVEGVRLGRLLFDNLRKLLMYIAAVHLPIAGLALLPLLLGWPPLLLPLHVVLIEMVIDPICAIAFERTPAEPDLMQRPPRDPGQALIGRPQLLLALLAGMLLLAACVWQYAWALQRGHSIEVARTLVMVVLTAGNLLLVRVLATRHATLPRLAARGQLAYWLVALATVAVLALVLSVPGLAKLFRLALPDGLSLLGAMLLGAGSVLLVDLLKPLKRVQRVLAG